MEKKTLQKFCPECGLPREIFISVDFIDNGEPFPVQHLCKCEEADADQERERNARHETELKIFDYIRRNRSVSWAELECYLNAIGIDYRGNLNVQAGDNENVIYWTGWNRAALEMITGLLKRKMIKKAPAGELTYLIDGKCLNFPVAKHTRIYKKPHWLPIVFEARGRQ